MKKFLSNPSVNRFCWLLFAVSTCVLSVYVLAGCGAPTWLTDAINIVPVLVASATSVLSFIAALSGNAVPAAILADITTWSTNVENGLKEVETLVQEYNANPSEPLIQQINDAVKLVVGDLQNILTVSGIPPAIATKIQSFAQLILTQLEAWATLLPALKPAPSVSSKSMAVFHLTAPLTKVQFKTEFNALLTEPTGDVPTDLALLKVKKL